MRRVKHVQRPDGKILEMIKEAGGNTTETEDRVVTVARDGVNYKTLLLNVKRDDE